MYDLNFSYFAVDVFDDEVGFTHKRALSTAADELFMKKRKNNIASLSWIPLVLHANWKADWKLTTLKRSSTWNMCDCVFIYSLFVHFAMFIGTFQLHSEHLSYKRWVR